LIAVFHRRCSSPAALRWPPAPSAAWNWLPAATRSSCAQSRVPVAHLAVLDQRPPPWPPLLHKTVFSGSVSSGYPPCSQLYKSWFRYLFTSCSVAWWSESLLPFVRSVDRIPGDAELIPHLFYSDPVHRWALAQFTSGAAQRQQASCIYPSPFWIRSSAV
jgi:hypothetical protein